MRLFCPFQITLVYGFVTMVDRINLLHNGMHRKDSLLTLDRALLC